MKSSATLYRMASTHHGMRRILKRAIPIDEYIRNAVRTGVYLDPDRPKDQKGLAQRNHLPAGYEILTMNPPLPNPPRFPVKYLRRKAHEAKQKKTSANQRDRLVQSFLDRRRTATVFDGDTEASVDAYYRGLLGIPAPTPATAMGQKSTLVNKAYAFAVKQEEIMRTSGVTEAESLDLVEQLLRDEARQERHASRHVQHHIQEWRTQMEEAAKREQAEKSDATIQEEFETFDATDLTKLDSFASNSSSTNDDSSTSSLPSILHSKPRTIQGIAIWSKKLQAVAYRDWTIGAAVALDHFVARSILELSEETWTALLEGDGDSSSLKSIGQDIVLTRKALFPETNIGNDHDDEGHDDNYDEFDASQVNELEDATNVGDKSIDELLSALGVDNVEEEENKLIYKGETTEKEVTKAYATKTEQLVHELQEWRQRNQEQDYQDWSENTKAEFRTWLKDYVNTLQPGDDVGIDYEETRLAILDAPPMTRDENDAFWDSLRDETEAEILLHNLNSDKEVGKHADDRLAPFWKLTHDEQVRRLVALGQMRPLVDEYEAGSAKAFLERHSNKLLEGLDLEHLVLDPKGPISGADLLRWSSSNSFRSSSADAADNIAETDRFSIVKMPYDGSNNKARALLEAWNNFKVGRAQYEEYLYREGKLGLRYGDVVLSDNDDDDDDDDDGKKK